MAEVGDLRIKKINAALSLTTILAALVHIGYTDFAYLAFYYNPALKQWTSLPFMVMACLHAVLGMAMVFLQADGTRLDIYPKRNLRTVFQRLSAVLIFPLLLLHVNTFDLLKASAGDGKWFAFALLMLSQPLFYATVLTHIAVSMSRALITLGWLSSREKQRTLDRIMIICCAALFAVTVWAVVKGQLAMFLQAGGTA